MITRLPFTVRVRGDTPNIEIINASREEGYFCLGDEFLLGCLVVPPPPSRTNSQLLSKRDLGTVRDT